MDHASHFLKDRLAHVQRWEELAKTAHFQPARMAALCQTSLRQLERYFRQSWKKTPRAWLREVRCRMAREFIAQGWSNKAVAIELFFANDSHLCHEFARFYSAPPRAFAPALKGFTEPDGPSFKDTGETRPGVASGQ